MNIHESAEDYLETILMLKERIGMVRSIDIANELGYSKPSVSIAMKKLRENGYIEVGTDGFITLCDSGLQIASRIYERHRTLSDFLMIIGVGEETAFSDACKIEHDLSDESYRRIKEHLRKIKKEGG